jgi:hypothetical protein
MSLATKDVQRVDDQITAIYKIIREYAESKNILSLKYLDVNVLIHGKGHSTEALDACLQEYHGIDVWVIDSARNITFVE